MLYWANLYMWMEDVPLDGRVYETQWHVLRAIAQVLMILTALWIGVRILVEKTEVNEDTATVEG